MNRSAARRRPTRPTQQALNLRPHATRRLSRGRGDGGDGVGWWDRVCVSSLYTARLYCE